MSDRGVYATVADLAALEGAARDFSFLHHQPARSVLTGRHGSRLRGRGLAFDELRRYLPGDDIRAIDWRVTARTGKPHVRVFTEERDRPTLLLVDQRLNMFFGSVRAMKSVAAAEVAALCAWRVLGQGDRVGGLVLDDARVAQYRPARSRAAVMRLLAAIVDRNGAMHAAAKVVRGGPRLNEALEIAASLAARDHLVIIIGDLDGHDPRTRALLSRLAAANDVVVMLVYDPFLLKLPRSGEIVVGDGEMQVELRLAHGPIRRGLAEFADARGREILGWRREIGATVLPISAAEEVAPQIRRLLGQALEGARRR